MEKQEQLESAIESLHQKFSLLGTHVANALQRVESNFEQVGKQVQDLHLQLKQIDKKVDSLKGVTDEGFDGVEMKLQLLTDEIGKINQVTHYDEHFHNLRAIRK